MKHGLMLFVCNSLFNVCVQTSHYNNCAKDLFMLSFL